MKKTFLLVILTFLLFSCTNVSPENHIINYPLFTLRTADYSNLHFENKIEDLLYENISMFDYFYNGGGVAIGDIDNDGLPDILFTGNQQPSKLYKNLGNLKFEDITIESGLEENDSWSTGATMADVNQDGWLDIYICHSGLRSAYPNPQNHLYI
jgi:hypothetical protein